MNPKKNDPNPPHPIPSLTEVLDNLADASQPLLNRRLAGLSDLDPVALQQFDAVWRQIDTERRRQIVSRLGEISEDNVEFSYNGLYKHLLADPDEMVRKAAVEGLWEDDEPSLIRLLLRLLADDPSTIVREIAAKALGHFTLMVEHQKIGPDNRERLSQALLKVIYNLQEKVNVRRRALESIAPLSLPEVTQAIWAAYRQEDTLLKAGAIFAMGKNCDLLWLPTIMRELSSDNNELRYEAVEASGELGELEAVPHLIEMLQDPDTDLRLASVVALGKIGGAEARRALRDCLASKSQVLREAAEQALEEIELFEEPYSPHGLGY
jgi:HEAT repeat protein